MKLSWTVWIAAGALALVAAACSDDSESGGGAGAANGGAAGAAGGNAGAAGEAGAAGQSAGGGAGVAGSAGVAGEAGSAGTAGAAGNGACAIVTGVGECDECINTSCQAECNKCAQNAECKAIFECVTGTCVSDAGQADMTCAMGCVTSHTGGMNDFFAFWQGTKPGCVTKNCAPQCGQ